MHILEFDLSFSYTFSLRIRSSRTPLNIMVSLLHQYREIRFTDYFLNLITVLLVFVVFIENLLLLQIVSEFVYNLLQIFRPRFPRLCYLDPSISLDVVNRSSRC